MFRHIRDEVFVLIEPRCPCYCGGEGQLILVACPACGVVMGRCDEVEELIRNVRSPSFDRDESICHADVPCPNCSGALYGDFRAATNEEIRALGIDPRTYRRWS